MTVALEDRILSVSEARKSFAAVLSEVRSGRSVTIHQSKHDDVTLVPRVFLASLLRQMESLTDQIESLEISADPELMKAIRRSNEDIRSGRTVKLSEAAQFLRTRKHLANR